MSRLQANIDVLAQRRTLLEADVRRVRQQLDAMRTTFAKRTETTEADVHAVTTTVIELQRESDALRAALRTARHSAPATTSQSIVRALNALIEQLDTVSARVAERVGEPALLSLRAPDGAGRGVNDAAGSSSRTFGGSTALTPRM